MVTGEDGNRISSPEYFIILHFTFIVAGFLYCPIALVIPLQEKQREITHRCVWLVNGPYCLCALNILKPVAVIHAYNMQNMNAVKFFDLCIWRLKCGICTYY